jgi:hypothetical protein
MQFEAQQLAARLELLRVEFLDREAHAVFVVLAGKRVRARQRSAHADAHQLVLGLCGSA